MGGHSRLVILLVFSLFVINFVSAGQSEGQSCGYMAGGNPLCNAGLKCAFFQCVPDSTQFPTADQSCSDSDGGKKPNNYGELSLNYHGSLTKVEDVCSDSKTLKEYYCNNDWSAMQYYTCSGSCIDGKCTSTSTSTSTSTCSDTDDGNKPNSAGKVTISYQGGSPMDYEDECINGKEVKEWYCNADWIGYQTWTCENECIDNQCTKDTINEAVSELTGGIGEGLGSGLKGLFGGLFQGMGNVLFIVLIVVVILFASKFLRGLF